MPDVLHTITLEELTDRTGLSRLRLQRMFRAAALTKFGRNYLREEVLAYFRARTEIANEDRTAAARSTDRRTTQQKIDRGWRRFMAE